MQQLPGRSLRKVLFEVGEEGSVRQVLESRSIVGHDVVLSWEEVRYVAVAV